MKKIFVEMSSWSQLFFLWLFFGLGAVVSMVLSAIIALFFIQGGNASDWASLVLESVDYLRIVQLTQQLLLFFVPACLCAYLFNKKGRSYLKINKGLRIDSLLISVFLIFIIQPLISFTSYYNRQMKLPESMSGIEAWMKNLEDSTALITERLLSGGSLEILLLNLVIVAIVAAVVEEFFFRGVLQQIFHKITNNYHWGVWIAAFIFSAIHMQFYGFVPRLLLGGLLGYLFVFSGSLWLPIIVHFTNNAMGVILFHFYNGTPQYETIENIGAKDMWWTALLSLLLTVVTLCYLSKDYTHRYKKNNF
ncbi:CPBP family intramembrane glutamic endopeptidase [Viscerimonas tarda]